MLAPRTSRMRGGMLFAVVSWCVLFVCAMPVEAQRGPGGGPGGGPGRPPPKRPPKTDRPSGSEQGRLIRFKPAKDGNEDEDLLGVLSIKAFGKDTRVVKIIVRRSDNLKVTVRGKDQGFDTEELGEVLWRGLYCTASWRLEDTDSKRKRKKKQLRELSFDTIEIEGAVYEIDDGMVIVKGVPKDGRQWPDVEAKARGGAGGRRNNPKRIIRRKIKLKVLDDLSTFLDAADDEMGLDDFEIGQEVEATIVYGRPLGMVVAMRIPSDGSGGNDDSGRDDSDTGRGGGGSGPVGPGGGLPGGGGGRGGGRGGR